MGVTTPCFEALTKGLHPNANAYKEGLAKARPSKNTFKNSNYQFQTFSIIH